MPVECLSNCGCSQRLKTPKPHGNEWELTLKNNREILTNLRRHHPEAVSATGGSKSASRIRNLFIAVLTLPAILLAGGAAAQDCRWEPSYPDLLGISADPGDPPVDFVEAVVTRPEKLADLGLYAVKTGDTVKLLCVGENLWRIKHYATGLSIVFSSVEIPHRF